MQTFHIVSALQNLFLSKYLLCICQLNIVSKEACKDTVYLKQK